MMDDEAASKMIKETEAEVDHLVDNYPRQPRATQVKQAIDELNALMASWEKSTEEEVSELAETTGRSLVMEAGYHRAMPAVLATAERFMDVDDDEIVRLFASSKSPAPNGGTWPDFFKQKGKTIAMKAAIFANAIESKSRKIKKNEVGNGLP
ncbi:MAG: hypothetical protein A3G34_08720 [Candidatus Lindowbacteria bacterium RIFCSPLOWO2_12_FULL_62_27]|nr:MAG: hypothetical protein A3G34_08720 [Candidatus Lindowbacteria bacterium RIFCSPLOWO2_12_FULL_62_27]